MPARADIEPGVLTAATNMNKTTVAHLKRSQFIVGLARAYRGLAGDMRVLVWLATRNRLIAETQNGPSLKNPQLGTSNNILEGWLNTDIPQYTTP